MRRWLLPVVAAMILLPASSAIARHLGKAEARAEAESKLLSWSLLPANQDWANDLNVGRCVRKSDSRVTCFTKAIGSEFTGHCSDTTFECTYIFHRCSFRVAVHPAGFFAKGRIHGVSCSSYSYTQRAS